MLVSYIRWTARESNPGPQCFSSTFIHECVCCRGSLIFPGRSAPLFGDDQSRASTIDVENYEDRPSREAFELDVAQRQGLVWVVAG